MSTHTVSKKRKSADGGTSVSKKAKTVKSAEKPAPLKSALKKPNIETKETTVAAKPAKGSGTVVQKVTAKSKDNETTQKSETTIIDDEESGSAPLTADQTAALLAGFSSSEDEDSENEGGIAISSLPKAPTAGAIQKRVKKAVSAQDNPDTTPGVIYVGRIPHGFYEPQMKAYFSQFGEITNLRLARNKKTGASQHHAFVEFASAAVADIVAKTMDKYLLFGHILQVRRVPREQVQEGLFKGAGRRKKPAPRNRLEGRKLKQGATRDVWEKRVEMENQRRAAKAEKLREMGYEFEMPVVKGVSEIAVRSKDDGDVVAGAEVDGSVKLLENGDVVETAKNIVEKSDQAAVQEKISKSKRPATEKVRSKHAKRVKT